MANSSIAAAALKHAPGFASGHPPYDSSTATNRAALQTCVSIDEMGMTGTFAGLGLLCVVEAVRLERAAAALPREEDLRFLILAATLREIGAALVMEHLEETLVFDSLVALLNRLMQKLLLLLSRSYRYSGSLLHNPSLIEFLLQEYEQLRLTFLMVFVKLTVELLPAAPSACCAPPSSSPSSRGLFGFKSPIVVYTTSILTSTVLVSSTTVAVVGVGFWLNTLLGDKPSSVDAVSKLIFFLVSVVV